MHNRNHGKTEISELQTKFTGYLIESIKKDFFLYCRKKERINKHEQPVDFQDLPPEALSQQHTRQQDDPAMVQAEIAALVAALDRLSDRDRRIFLARVLEERDFGEMGSELGLGYQGVAAAYRRARLKLNKILRRDL